MDELPPIVHGLIQEFLPDFDIQGKTMHESGPDGRVMHNDMDIGGWVIKADTGGNTYGQTQRHYVAAVQRLQQAGRPALAYSCVPMLYMELNAATLRVCAAAYQEQSFLCEPLMPALHLYCVNNPAHMNMVVRCVTAIRVTLSKLAPFYTRLGQQESPEPFRQTPAAVLPYYFARARADARITQLLSRSSRVFLVAPQGPPSSLVKFVPRRQSGDCSAEVHRAWAGVGCAAELVGTSCPVCTWPLSVCLIICVSSCPFACVSPFVSLSLSLCVCVCLCLFLCLCLCIWLCVCVWLLVQQNRQKPA